MPEQTTTTRRFYAFFSIDRDDVSIFDARIVDAMNWLLAGGYKRNTLAEGVNDLGMIFEQGLLATENLMKADGIERPRYTAVTDAVKTARLEDAINARMTELYERWGLDQFADWAEMEDIPPEEWQPILANYGTELFNRDQSRPWVDKAREWLGETLAEGPKKVGEVKTLAVAGGIVDPDSFSKDWNKLTVLAHREGLTAGRRGWWGEKVV